MYSHEFFVIVGNTMTYVVVDTSLSLTDAREKLQQHYGDEAVIYSYDQYSPVIENTGNLPQAKTTDDDNTFSIIITDCEMVIIGPLPAQQSIIDAVNLGYCIGSTGSHNAKLVVGYAYHTIVIPNFSGAVFMSLPRDRLTWE